MTLDESSDKQLNSDFGQPTHRSRVLAAIADYMKGTSHHGKKRKHRRGATNRRSRICYHYKPITEDHSSVKRRRKMPETLED